MVTSYLDEDFPAKSYLAHRPRYPEVLFDVILDYHKTGGQAQGVKGEATQDTPQNKLLLDLGCGPGIATRELVKYFEQVIGMDESEHMIELAQGYVPEARFICGSANALSAIETNSVDMLTVAAAAHWFPEDWWQEASRVVKRGGTVALWVYSETMFLSPSEPKAQDVNQIIMEFRDGTGHYTPGNEVAFNLYDSLTLPAPKLNFGPVKRISWNRTSADDSEAFMSSKLTIDKLRGRMHTYSQVYRWQMGNPSKVGTDEDPVEKTLENMKEISGFTEESEFVIGNPLALLLLKKIG